MSREKLIEEMIEYLNNTINVERNSYFGKGRIILPIIEAEIILDILKGYRKQNVCENIIEQNHVDEFQCSECGIVLCDWTEEKTDVEDGDKTYHEYEFKFCPNCGAKVKVDI